MMRPPRSPPWADRNWPPEEPCEKRPLGDHSWASISAAGRRVPAALTAVPCTTIWPPLTTSGSAVTPCTIVLSAPTLMVSPASSCGVKVVQQPPAPGGGGELRPPGGGGTRGLFALPALAMVTPSRTTDTAAPFAKPASSTSDVLAVTVIALLTPATAAGADVGAAHAAQPATATATGDQRRRRAASGKRGMGMTPFCVADSQTQTILTCAGYTVKGSHRARPAGLRTPVAALRRRALRVPRTEKEVLRGGGRVRWRSAIGEARGLFVQRPVPRASPMVHPCDFARGTPPRHPRSRGRPESAETRAQAARFRYVGLRAALAQADA